MRTENVQSRMKLMMKLTMTTIKSVEIQLEDIAAIY